MYRHIATTLYSRGEASIGDKELNLLPYWVWMVVALNVIVFLPLSIISSYTLQLLYPTLAIVEDPSPPAYDAVSMSEDGRSTVGDGLAKTDSVTVSKAPAITSSLRSIHRALLAVGGWRSLFRGFAAYFSVSTAANILTGIFLRTLGGPAFIHVILARLALVQPYAAWTHVMISTPSSKYFWQRFPSFGRAFRATALPVSIHAVATMLAAVLPLVVASLLRMNVWNTETPEAPFKHDKDDVWKGIIVLLVALALHLVLVIPAHVALVRVQASFLPDECDTIVPMDRSFGGKVEPAIVNGKGYLSMRDALKTFTRASRVRLIKLYVRIFAVVTALGVLAVAVLAPQYFLLAKVVSGIENPNAAVVF
ncbi:ubiquitin carrier protein [Xylaria sp. CBS 124048]|nr:ubiquitin carrier protein [Xylaria sp. CBS 124048]